MKRGFFLYFFFFFPWLLDTWHAIVSWKLVSKDFKDITLFCIAIENYRGKKLINTKEVSKYIILLNPCKSSEI